MKQEATNVCNQYHDQLHSHPRYLLISADVTAIEDQAKAIELYQKFVAISLDNDFKSIDYSDERYIVHPNLMLGKLYFKNKQFRKARQHLKIALETTTDREKRHKIKPLFRLTTLLQILG
jgi:uncharacterized protein HemY